ncbi:short-chain dehydrogenase/reductase family oxidoreductase [Mycobacterium kansasii]|uniref:Short-chain dehydrogenase/reductase family oxidoreductase n=1 Tax=Mycobacterium kansasii TaxID=1768 RepID=A0A1V3W8U6_MYCKA|nr:short-chain dehydrogenase/reductase family oxidoreductase [Mycobacterium kansasii]
MVAEIRLPEGTPSHASNRWPPLRAARRSSRRRWNTTGDRRPHPQRRHGAPRLVEEMSYQDFDSVIDVHLRGASTWCGRRPAHVCCALRPYRIDVVDRRPLRQSWRGQLRRRQSRPGGLSNAVALEGARKECSAT